MPHCVDLETFTNAYARKLRVRLVAEGTPRARFSDVPILNRTDDGCLVGLPELRLGFVAH
ncbi:MAG TPA: hypothetical protein VJ865_02755 [Gemmatimonadaceae bacterium]|nr:hypothetical protein [Gemmatimonadaceae bacterium]